MKSILLIFSMMVLGLNTFAAEEASTEAKWFSPGCPECEKLLKPGKASIGNNVGVYHPGSKKKKPATGTATGAVSSGN